MTTCCCSRSQGIVALKMTAIGAEERRKAAREAVILQKVRHKHVCSIEEHHDFGREGLFVMARPEHNPRPALCGAHS